MTARVLVLFAHPALQKSRINRHLAAVAQENPIIIAGFGRIGLKFFYGAARAKLIVIALDGETKTIALVETVQNISPT